ncbi:Hexosyltransferase [Caenorhabditis elegans]|uniref:Hexosyltransferase n=1 Tax=Caenorhabditis elegans TaxID=6239 RepID=Q8MQG4_CAEEL|nr:Hexosyltransferase [Caenorhabditis elegans]CAD44086.2 Hexosyltransferase [Caenorhabditis elegans]|eukprot:NP_741615.2 Hexosyltransferase [Caenorhabditis elegans]
MNLCRKLWKYLLGLIILYVTVFLNLDRIRSYSTDAPIFEVTNSFSSKSHLSKDGSTNQFYHAQFKDQNHTYQFITVPKKQCSNNTKLQITILSTAGNFDIRQAIRETWANPNNSEHVANNDVRISFIISKTSNEFLNFALQKEIEKFDDMIVTDLYESYELLILKVHAILSYKQSHCQLADFQLKIDDDMAVDMDGLYRSLEDKKQASINGISGIIWKNSPPVREKKHRWYVPKTLYSEKFFPPYIDGPIYLIGKNAVPRMLEEAKNYNQWIIEDVFWTGVIGKALKIKQINWANHLLRYVIELIPSRLKCSKGGVPLIYAVHNMKGPQMIHDGYQKLKGVKCK